MGVGAQGEPRVIVAQHTADGFYIHTVLQGQRGKGMPEIVKAYVRQPGIFQNFLVQVYDGVWVVHLTGCRRGEHIRVVGIVLVFGDQQVNSLLWDTDLSDRCLCLGAGEGQLSVRIFDILLADGDGFVRDVEVAPEKRRDLALPQAR